MNIYEPESDGSVDLRLALDELKRIDGMHPTRQKAALGEITAAALLDIAGSLRVLAVESASAMREASLGYDTEDDEPDIESDDDLLVEGDLVAVEGFAEPGEIRAFRHTEGEFFATVDFADGSTIEGIALSKLERLRGDERDDDILQDAAESVDVPETPEEPPIVPSIEAAPEDVVDDIDSDFEGDRHDEAEAALEKLKANEAARKAAKKAATKKGTKK